MKGSARLGQALAVTWLVLLYPTAAALFHGYLTGLRVAGTLLLLAVFITVYVGFWLRWLGPPNLRQVTGAVIVLVGLGIASPSPIS